MLTHSARALLYSTALCLSACKRVFPSICQTVNRSSVCYCSDSDGWRDSDDAEQDTIRLLSAIDGMLCSMRLCPCPPHDTEDNMSSQTWEGPSGVLGRDSRGAISMWFQPRAKGGGREASLERWLVTALPGQETFTTLCERETLSEAKFFSCLSSQWSE